MRIIRLRRPKPVVEEAPLERQLQEIADLLLAAKGAFLKTGQRLLARKELATLDPQHYQFSTDLMHLGMTPGAAWDWIAAYRAAHFYSLTEEEAVHLGVSQLKKLQGWLSNRLRDTTNDRTVLRVAYATAGKELTSYIKHLQSVTPHHFDFSSLSVLEYAALIINAKSLLRSEGVGSLARLFQKLVGRALADRTKKAARTAAHEHPRKGFFASISRAFTRSHVSS